MSWKVRMELSFADPVFDNDNAGIIKGRMIEVLVKNDLLPHEIVTYADRIEQVIRRDRRQWVPDDDMEPWARGGERVKARHFTKCFALAKHLLVARGVLKAADLIGGTPTLFCKVD
ncbi:hypothetical protein [Microvirga pakistanensis]|uniref:hypothetical protein n=1 Tax=Microvirga pakistanensis TaxID=1682650 RepID=UPI00106C5F93|nr:hypothetical protein [Microvirga pakistanensis]